MIVEQINKHQPECLVFFNPMGCDRAFLKNSIPADILENFEILLVEYPGYNSPEQKLESFQDLADLVHQEILIKINKPFHLIGYSYGGLLVQHILNNFYDFLKSVTLISCLNSLGERDREIVSVLKTLVTKDLFLFCRTLTLFSHSVEDFRNTPLMGLQKFSNIKLSLSGVQPLLQQLNHILKIKEIKIRPQATPVNIIMGQNDRLIDAEQMDKFSMYFTNLNISILEGESHILNMNKVYDILTLFLTQKSYGSVND